MSRAGYSIEQLLEITLANADAGAQVLVGSGAPGGSGGPQDDAPIGSTYLDVTGGGYIKEADANSLADWALKIGSTKLDALLGISSKTASDFGTFTGATLSDNSDVKSLLQELETALEAINGAALSSAAAVTTVVTLDEVSVDDVQSAEWEIVVTLDSDPTRKKFLKVAAIHDGDTSNDATVTSDNAFSKLKVGATFATTIDTDVNGVGGAQTMRLQVTASSAATFKARRTDF